MKPIHAIYENGVFRPLGVVDLPDQAEGEFVPQIVRRRASGKHLDDIYEILSQSFDTDDSDLASRHNEHQP